MGHPAAEPSPPAFGAIYIGTCGYSFRDWVGPFYPPKTRPPEMLPYYARRFGAVEIDVTYYRIPPARTFAQMAGRTPAAFRFTVKAPAAATHAPLDASGPLAEEVARLREAVAPLIEHEKLGCLLLQFPTSFQPGAGAQRRLQSLAEAYDGLPLVAEFRHRAWQTPRTMMLLRELGIGWCNVDEPDFKTLVRPSADLVGAIAYVRLHGRNRRAWWRGGAAERFNYLYTREELEPWTARVADLAAEAREVYVFFNNCHAGKSARNARDFAQMMGLAAAPADEGEPLSLFEP
ncbi:MAG: DUF72 domain-containing protein [bacterium]|nr:DUF72 domain-containing protein [bacterium]